MKESKGLTALGKSLRTLRIDREVTMKEMANVMGVSVAFLSAIETGSKPMPSDKLERIIGKYDIKNQEATTLRSLAAKSKHTVRIKPAAESRELVSAFARRLGRLNDADRKAIMIILNKGE